MPLSAPVGVLVETDLHVRRNRCALSYTSISERATRAPAFGFHCLCVCATLSLSLRLFLCQISLSFSAGSPRLSLRLSLRVSLSLRLSLSLRNSLSLSLCDSLSRPPHLPSFLFSPQPQIVLASASEAYEDI